MKLPLVCLSAALLALSPTLSHAADSAQSVKTYLVDTVTKMKAASADYVKNADAYAALVKKNGGDYKKVWADNQKEASALVKAMQDNYKAMDSFGYETVEGIVAGVEPMAHYDIYLDAGVPAGQGSEDEVAPVTLKLSDGKILDKKGSLFTYIIEPALWGGNADYVVEVAPKTTLPKAEILTASAADVDAKIGALLADSKAWTPTNADLIGAMVTMTPTLSDYFEDWKESRYSDQKSGRFQAVSRISDMRGIMKSCSVMYDAVNASVSEKDKALAGSIKKGFGDILAFLDTIDAKEAKKEKISVAQIDELASQAKDRTDKLVPQIEQAGALVNKKSS
jgi:hypothetical protein